MAAGDNDPERQREDLRGINAMLQDYAAQFRDIVHAEWSNPTSRDWNKPDPLSRKFHCATLCPHQINKAMLEKLSGFRQLTQVAQAEDLGVAFSLAVCHFKPGPDADGLYRINNPEAIVIVRAEPEKDFKETALTVYADRFAQTQQYTVGLEEPDRYAVLRPLRFKPRT